MRVQNEGVKDELQAGESGARSSWAWGQVKALDTPVTRESPPRPMGDGIGKGRSGNKSKSEALGGGTGPISSPVRRCSYRAKPGGGHAGRSPRDAVSSASQVHLTYCHDLCHSVVANDPLRTTHTWRDDRPTATTGTARPTRRQVCRHANAHFARTYRATWAFARAAAFR